MLTSFISLRWFSMMLICVVWPAHGTPSVSQANISPADAAQKLISPKDTSLAATSLQNAPATLISVNFKNIALRDALQFIANYHDINLVMADSVAGTLTLNLEDVPWQQALAVILQLKQLEQRIDGNVIIIASAQDFARWDAERIKQKQRSEQYAELEPVIIPVHFAKGADLVQMIKNNESGGFLSSRGSISLDKRTNSLLVRDFPANIKAVRAIVRALDIPIKQVQIEARIVTVSEGSLQELGVRWGLHSQNQSLVIGSSVAENTGAVTDQASIDDYLNVNLAAVSPNAASMALQVASLGADTLLDLELSALQQEAKAEIISSPRLLTTNKKPAYIEQGTEIPYLEASSSGSTSVAFKKAVLSLEVTPQITPDNRLILDLSVTQDRPGSVVNSGTGEAVAIHTQRIGTQVLVDDGETIVLGGIFQQTVNTSTEKVPLLGDLPLLGHLFRRNYENIGKSELLIFVTPRVVNEKNAIK